MREHNSEPNGPWMFQRFLLRLDTVRGAGPTDYKPWGNEAQTQHNTNQSKLKAKCQTRCKLQLQIFAFPKEAINCSKTPLFFVRRALRALLFLQEKYFPKTPNCFTNLRLADLKGRPFFEKSRKVNLGIWEVWGGEGFHRTRAPGGGRRRRDRDGGRLGRERTASRPIGPEHLTPDSQIF